MSGERFLNAPSRNAFSALFNVVPDDIRSIVKRLFEAIVFKNEMYEFTGFRGLLSGAAAAPTTAELQSSGEWCFWTNTGDSKVYHAVNIGGTVYTVEMT
jgi:hypothetical protein